MNKIAEIHMKVSKLRVCNICGKIHMEYVCPGCGSSTWHGITNEEYRTFLTEITGKNSCRKMNEVELDRVLHYLSILGFDKNIDEAYTRAQNAKKKQISLVYKIGKKVLGPETYESRIKGFMEKTIGKKYIWHCDEKELRKIIGWLRRLDAKNKVNAVCEN